MALHSKQASSTLSKLGLLLTASAVAGLFGTAAACSSDSSDDPAKGGSSASGSSSGGTSANGAGESNNDAGTASNNGGTASNNGGTSTGGDTASGGMPDENGGTAAGGKNQGGTSSSAGSSSGGSSSGGSSSSNLPGDDNWTCVEAGGSCICQNNANPKDANSCTGTYKCCYAVPLGGSTRCQCQDPGTSKCEDLAHFFGPQGKVVDSCPQK
jgi:hypothetical protein